MIRRIVVASISIIALSAAANAADIYAPSPSAPWGGYKDAYTPIWVGFYGGVNGGYAWGGTSTVSDSEFIGGALQAEAITHFNPSGGFGGGQIGYNWQGIWHPHLVLGIEADIQGADIDGSGTATLDPTHFAHGTSRLDWFGTLRGRLGYACDRTLFYATGGLAFGGIHDTLSKLDGAGTGFASKSDTATGFVVGGGVEYAISPTWSLKAEYQFIDLGKDTLSADSVVPAVFLAQLDANHTYNTVRVGVNYHLLPDYEPLK